MLEATLRHWPKFVEDLRVIQSQNFTRPITRKNNAAEFFAERLIWEMQDHVPAEAQSAAKQAHSLIQKHLGWTSDPALLKELLANPELKSIDPSWTRQLAEYDHLDLSVTKRQQDQFARLPSLDVISRIGVIASLPTPNFTHAIDLATVAVLQAHLSKASHKEVVATLEVFHQLFHLFQSSPTLLDQTLSVAALGRRQALIESLKIKGVPYVPRDLQLRYRRVAWMWAHVLTLVSLKEFESALNEVRPYMKTTNFICGGSDPVTTISIFKDVLRTRWPLAPNFADALLREEAFLRETAELCGTKLTEILLALPGPKGNPMQFEIPYISSIFFSILNSIAVPNFAAQYDTLEREGKAE